VGVDPPVSASELSNRNLADGTVARQGAASPSVIQSQRRQASLLLVPFVAYLSLLIFLPYLFPFAAKRLGIISSLVQVDMSKVSRSCGLL
jgi:hypothetical protein